MGKVLSRSRLGLAVALCLTLAVLFALSAAPAALAAPSDPTISTADLQTLIDGGTVDGYFKTVVSGETIVNIPVHVLAVVPNAGLNGTPLIMFEAYGAQMDKIGGIAAGMSGSPLYVDDAGTDKLAGAVSYGDIFTTGGLGLATPIQAMIDIEEGYNLVHSSMLSSDVTTTRLAQPVATAGGTIAKIAVAGSAKAAKTVNAGAGTAVLAPLAVVEVGGLRRDSHAYQFLSKKFAAMGIELRLGVSPSGSDPNFETALIGGASVADMLMSGDLWAGAVGAVTYTNGDNVVAFGHPFDWAGAVETELANAWVSGIWSSTYEPYKMVVPGKTRGAFTQDRANGIAGTLSYTPETVPLTFGATMNGTARTSSTSSQMPSWAFNDGGYSWLSDYGIYDIFAREADSYSFAGTANTTTTITVNDGTQDYVLTRDNLFGASGNSMDYGPMAPDEAAAMELDNMVYYLTSNPDGLAPATIKSIDFQTNLDPAGKTASIVGMSVRGGLKVGDNVIDVSLREYGNPDLVHVNVPVTITNRQLGAGTLTVYSADTFSSYDPFSDYGYSPSATTATVAEKVAEIQGWAQNNDITAAFVPYDPDNGPYDPSWSGAPPQDDVVGLYQDTRVLSGYQLRETTRMRVVPSRSVVSAGSPIILRGSVSNLGMWRGMTPPATSIDIYKRPHGATSYTLVKTVPMMYLGQQGLFACRIAHVRKSTSFKAVWGGDDLYLGCAARTSVTVRP